MQAELVVQYDLFTLVVFLSYTLGQHNFRWIVFTMKELLIYLLLVIVGISVGELPPPERSYKILMLLPTSTQSHRNVFISIAEALADRGHKIVMISNSKTLSKHPNIDEVFHELPHFNVNDINMFERRSSSTGGFEMLIESLTKMARDLHKVPKVKEIYDKRKEFDLIVVNHMYNEMAYPFAHEMPFITIATIGYDPRHSAVLGNPLNPAYMPNILGGFDLSSVFGRMRNVLRHIMIPVYIRKWAIVPAVQKEITKQFPDLPPLLEIERNQSLTLMNSHFSLGMAIPLLPSQVEVGGMHCRPGKSLPQNIKSWIEGAGSAGVVYFSLGSVVRGDAMPIQYRNMFIEAFKKIKQRVIWKFEGDLKDVSKNVMLNKWLPQQDVLADPNVKVFITHGGLLSIQEASYHGMPMLAMLIFGDQTKNGEEIVNNGFGLSLVWEKLTVDMIVESLQEIISHPKYKENIGHVSNLFRDQITTPKDRAVFWTEYVIRHKGAPNLRSPAAELSWIQFLMLDILAILLLGLFMVYLILRWVLRTLFAIIFCTSNKKKKRE